MYSAGAGVDLKVRSRHSRARFSMMAMHVDMICVLVWIRGYADSISVFTINMCLVDHLSRMDVIM